MERTESRVFLYSAVEIMRSPVASFFFVGGAMVWVKGRVGTAGWEGMGMMGWWLRGGKGCRAARADGEGRDGGEGEGGQWGGMGLSDRRPSLTRGLHSALSAAHPPPQTPTRPANFVPFRP